MSNEVLYKKIFRNNDGTLLSLKEIVDEIQKYVEVYPKSSYEVVVGSDSQAGLSGTGTFVTAVVVRRIGNGGRSFWTKRREKFYSLKDRIWKETMLSVTLAQELRSCMKEQLGEEIFWEKQIDFKCIHLDVGEDGPTKELIDGVSGMVKGYGFVPVIKPYSYGAFVVADKHT